MASNNFLKTVVATGRERYRRWIDRRIPPSREVALTQKNIFIFPNKQALLYFLLVALIWLGATNYENNLSFALSFLLIAVFIVGILHTFNNVSGLKLQFVYAEPVFEGEFTSVEIFLSRQHGSTAKHSVTLGWHKDHQTTASLSSAESVRINVSTQALKRGLYRPGRIAVTSVYPLGIIRCWSHIDLNVAVLTYPKPVYHADLPGQSISDTGSDESIVVAGSEDFDSLQDFIPGSSLRQISWKHYAKGQGLKSKLYSDYVDSQLWLRWGDFNLSTEAKLSNFCYWILELDKQGRPYGLELPGVSLEPSTGQPHKELALKTLALYGVQEGS